MKATDTTGLNLTSTVKMLSVMVSEIWTIIKIICQALFEAFFSFCNINVPIVVSFKLPHCVITECRAGREASITYYFLLMNTININDLKHINNSKVQQKLGNDDLCVLTFFLIDFILCVHTLTF